LSNGSCSLRPFRPIAPIALLGIIAWGSPARATELRVDGDYRIRIANNTNLQLDGQPSYLGQETWAEQRMRLTPVIAEADQIEVTAQFDIFSGLFAGDTAPSFDGLGWSGRSTRNSLQATGFDFRAMYAQFNLGYGMLKFGQMPRDWGMGLLWNAGNESETVDFGDQRFGDIVERVIFTNRPFDFLGPRNPLSNHLQLLLGGDLIYRDRFASLIERNGGGLEWGDRALEFFGGLNYVDGESLRIGLVALRRIQTYVRDGGDLHDWTFDLYARTAEPSTAGPATSPASIRRAPRRSSRGASLPARASPSGSWRSKWRAAMRAATRIRSIVRPIVLITTAITRYRWCSGTK
jgi:hypothetical protein